MPAIQDFDLKWRFDMDFLVYLWPSTEQILSMVQTRFKVAENAPICRKHDAWGWLHSLDKRITICTRRIQQSENVEGNINETILHESVHAGQACKSNDGYVRPFGISIAQMPIEQWRKDGVKAAVSLGSERAVEHEAHWMEDKPDKVRYVVQKYCL